MRLSPKKRQNGAARMLSYSHTKEPQLTKEVAIMANMTKAAMIVAKETVRHPEQIGKVATGVAAAAFPVAGEALAAVGTVAAAAAPIVLPGLAVYGAYRFVKWLITD